MKRVMVLGASGMLGHCVATYLSEGALVFGGVRKRYRYLPFFKGVVQVPGCDVQNLQGIEDILLDINPHVIINCLGVVKQRVSNQIEMVLANAIFPHWLLGFCHTHLQETRIIHISTDCVFAGDKGNYTETDLPDAVDDYGMSKISGELVGNANVLTLRTSFIGPELDERRQGLMEWARSMKGTTVGGFAKAYFSGLTTLEFAKVIGLLVHDYPTLYGLYHVSGPAISKLDLVALISRVWNLKLTIIPVDDPVVDRSLDGSRFRDEIMWGVPSWLDMLNELQGWERYHNAK
jgi:dTDP-4-dehydrorhamnose reductase